MDRVSCEIMGEVCIYVSIYVRTVVPFLLPHQFSPQLRQPRATFLSSCRIFLSSPFFQPSIFCLQWLYKIIINIRSSRNHRLIRTTTQEISCRLTASHQHICSANQSTTNAKWQENNERHKNTKHVQWKFSASHFSEQNLAPLQPGILPLEPIQHLLPK